MKHAHNQITDDLRCRLNVELARLLCEITFHQARTMDAQSGKGNNEDDEKDHNSNAAAVFRRYERTSTE